MKIYIPNIILLLLCVLSRILSSLYYAEDVESLGFALSIADFDLTIPPPHFGAPVFNILTEGIYLLVGNLPIAFSIVGGLGVFLIIYFSLNLLQVPLLSLEGILTTLLLFFNPLIWLTSNRYLPDVLAVASLMACFYYLVPDHYKISQVYKGFFIAGLSVGIKISYFPFLIVPFIYAVVSNKKYLPCIGYFMLGLIIWLLPVLLELGWTNFISASKANLSDFFIQGLNGFKSIQILTFIENLWTDGLGGFWLGRSSFTLIISVGILFCSFFGLIILLSFDNPKSKIYVIAGTLLTYAIWAIVFPNPDRGVSEVLPLVPCFVIAISYGIIYFVVNYNYLSAKLLVLVFLITNMVITLYLVVQHRNPTAIAQVKMYMDEIKKKNNDSVYLVSAKSINYYLEAQKVQGKFYNVDSDEVVLERLKKGNVIAIGERPILLKGNPKKITAFHHNPEVNRLWADIWVYEY